jgi:hypothetical protein
MNSVNISSAAASTMLNKLSCLAATVLVYEEHEPFDRVVQASSLYRISVSSIRQRALAGVRSAHCRVDRSQGWVAIRSAFAARRIFAVARPLRVPRPGW